MLKDSVKSPKSPIKITYSLNELVYKSQVYQKYICVWTYKSCKYTSKKGEKREIYNLVDKLNEKEYCGRRI